MPDILLRITGQNTAGAAIDRAVASLGALDRAMASVSATGNQVAAVMDRIGAALDRVNAVYGTAAGAVDAWAANQARAAASVDLVTTSIRAQTVAMGALLDAQRLSAATAAKSAVAPKVAASGGVGRAGRVLTGGLAADVGLGGRVAAAALGPEGLAVGGLLYGGFKASQAASGFQSAEAQTGAQIGNPGVAAATAKAILAYTSGGKSPYSATNLMASIEPLLAHQYSQATINAGIVPLAQLSAQNKAPDLGTSVNAVNTYLATMGAGSKSTAAQMVDAVNYVSKLEKLTTIPPGQLSAALPRLLTSAQGTGLTPEAAGAALLKVGTANPSARLDSTQLGRVFQEMLVHNTVGAQREALSLGLVMGPGALASYGGSFQAMVQAYATATAGPNQAAELSKLFPTTGTQGGLMAVRELISGGGTQQTLGYEAQLAKRGGAAQAAYAAYSQGIHQQEVQLANQFNSDMVRLGSTINQTVVPALLLMAASSLNVVNDAANVGSWVGSAFQNVAKTLHVPGGAGTLVAGLAPAGIGLDTALMKGLYDHGIKQVLGQVGNQAQQQGGNAIGNQGRVPVLVGSGASGPGYQGAPVPYTGRINASTSGVEGIFPLRSMQQAISAVIPTTTPVAQIRAAALAKMATDLGAGTTTARTTAARTARFINAPGVGALEAGVGSTAVRFAGQLDPEATELRTLRTELRAANTKIAGYEAEVVDLMRQLVNQGNRISSYPPNKVVSMGGGRSYKG